MQNFINKLNSKTTLVIPRIIYFFVTQITSYCFIFSLLKTCSKLNLSQINKLFYSRSEELMALVLKITCVL